MREEISMKEKGTFVSTNSLIWFGTGVPIAKILTGTYPAPLGSGKGLATIVLGHVTGCILLFMAGLIGGHTRRSSMETVKISFGQGGSLLFCGLNVLQLVDWASIMIYNGSLAANGIYGARLRAWYLVTDGLVLVWLLIGIRNLEEINTVAMATLFMLTLVLRRVVFTGNVEPSMEAGGSLSLGVVVELSVIMPLSWLSLISDYTRDTERPFGATAVSAVVYGLVSCFMCVIGIEAATYTDEYGISVTMVKAGLGAAGLLIIVLPTVAATFLDAYSTGVSSVSITHRIREKWAAVVVTTIGTATAMVYPIDNITDFFHLIGSVLTPIITIQIADYFIIRQDHEAEAANLANLVIWLAGFMIYRILMRVDTPVGGALLDAATTVVLCVVCDRVTAAVRAFPSWENVTKVWYLYKVLYEKALRVSQYAPTVRVT